VGWTSTASVTPHLATGRVRLLAASSAVRTPFFPETPTLAEAGIPRTALSNWVAMLGPAALPGAVAERLYGLLVPAFDDHAFRQRLTALGIEPDLRPAGDLHVEMLREDAFWAAAAKTGTLKPAG